MSDTYLKPDFHEAYERALHEDDAEWPRDYLWVSDLSAGLEDGCKRQLFHKLAADERKDNTVGELLRFRFGDRIHEDVAEMVADHVSGDWQVTGVEVYGNHLPHDVTSRSDIRMNSPEDGDVVVEVKTSRGRAFSYRDGPDDLREAHKLQTRANIMALDADYGILHYLDREGSNAPQSFIVESDDEQVVEIIEELQPIIDDAHTYAIARRAEESGLIESSEIPEPPEPLAPEIKRNENKGADSIEISEPWNCDYCPFRRTVCPGAVPDQLKSDGVILKDKEDGYEIYNDKLDDEHLPDLIAMVEAYE